MKLAITIGLAAVELYSPGCTTLADLSTAAPDRCVTRDVHARAGCQKKAFLGHHDKDIPLDRGRQDDHGSTHRTEAILDHHHEDIPSTGAIKTIMTLCGLITTQSHRRDDKEGRRRCETPQPSRTSLRSPRQSFTTSHARSGRRSHSRALIATRTQNAGRPTADHDRTSRARERSPPPTNRRCSRPCRIGRAPQTLKLRHYRHSRPLRASCGQGTGALDGPWPWFRTETMTCLQRLPSAVGNARQSTRIPDGSNHDGLVWVLFVGGGASMERAKWDCSLSLWLLDAEDGIVSQPARHVAEQSITAM